ncbi:MAG: hypothetical protein CL886_03590 [Dehalococcoidia bacterium]|nr:hypothetical protein [Dehalococcoidia bacterium]|tara:strand:- start:5708 stop:6730 length:1023 start_codon:yes stop_codon:yes gene_type:complete
MTEDRINSGGPIFITGVYRSGTTLISQLLNNHPDLRVIHDTLHFFRFYLGKYNPINDRYKDIVQDASDRLHERYNIKVPVHDILYYLKQLPNISFGDIYNELMIYTFCDGNRKIRWGEKSLIQWSNIPVFLQMFPNGQVIHMVRDPRDVLASYREMTNELPHKYLDAIFACLHSMNWASTVGPTLRDKSYLILRHEDLVKNPKDTINNVCAFLDIPYLNQMMDFSQYKDQAGNEWKPNTSFNDIPNKITATSAERWKQQLSPFEIGLVESVIGDLLETFGYCESKIQLSAADLQLMWKHIQSTPLIQQRLRHWIETGEGVERYPSDPTNSINWESLVQTN